MIHKECNCQFAQSDVKIRVPAKNIKSFDVIYRIPEPLLLSNIDDTTSRQTCSCTQNTNIVISREETNILENNLANGRNSINNETMSHQNSPAEKLISLMPNKRDVYLTPMGKDGLTAWFQKSNQIQRVFSTKNTSNLILETTNVCR